MANLKITELPEQTANPAADDLFVTIDVSDPVPTNQTKKIRSDKLYVHSASQLAANVVETAKIKDANVTTAKIAVGSAGYHLITNAAGVVAWTKTPVIARYTSAAWDGVTKAVGTYDLNLNTVFGVPTAAQVVFISASAKWATASNGNYMSISPSRGLGWRGIVLRSIVANMEIDGCGLLIVPSNGTICVDVGGANTTLTILQIEGYLL